MFVNKGEYEFLREFVLIEVAYFLSQSRNDYNYNIIIANNDINLKSVPDRRSRCRRALYSIMPFRLNRKIYTHSIENHSIAEYANN